MASTRIGDWLLRHMRLPALCIVGMFILSTGAFTSEFAPLRVLGQGAIALALALGIGAMLRWKATKPVFCGIGDGLGRLQRIPAAVYVSVAMAAFFIVAATLSGALFDHLPHVADSQSQYIGAKIFATGHWFAPSPDPAGFFDVQFMVNDGKFYSNYPPGHMLIQSLGHRLGLPWLVNPLLGALALAAIYALAREIADPATAKIAVLLALFSPFLMFMSSEYMNHATTLICATLFLLFYIRTLRGACLSDALLCGLSIGYLFITRPQTAVPFALPVAAHYLYRAWRDRRYCAPALTSLAGCCVMLGFLSYYNIRTTGHPLLMGYMLDKRPDFAAQAFTWPFGSWHSAMAGFANAASRVVDLQEGLFGWPSFSLLFVFLLFLCRAQKPYCGLVMASCIVLALALMFTHFGDTIFGPRYLYEASGVLIVLTALACKRLPAVLRALFPWRWRRAELQGGIAMLVCILFIFALLQTDRRLYEVYADNYWEGNAGFYHGIVNRVQAPALVFVRDPERLYRFVSFTLPLDEHAKVIFARDRQGLNAELTARYPGRHAYMADLRGVTPWQPDAAK